MSVQDIVTIIGCIVAIASIIVKITPTPKDDAVLAKVLKILNLLAINPKDNKKG